MRLVVVALRAVDHQADHGPAGPVGAAAARCHSVIAAYGLCAPPRGSLAHQRAQRLAPARRAAALRVGGACGPRRKSSGQIVRATKASPLAAPRSVSSRDARKCSDEASEYERLSAIFGTSLHGDRTRGRDDELLSACGKPGVTQPARRRDPDQRRKVDRRAGRAVRRPVTDVVEGADTRLEAGRRKARARHGDCLATEVPGGLAQCRLDLGAIDADLEVGRRIQAEAVFGTRACGRRGGPRLSQCFSLA